MPEIHANSAMSTSSSPKHAAVPAIAFRILGLALLVAAILLHVRQAGQNRRRQVGAANVAAIAKSGVIGMGLRAVPAPGASEPLFEPCSATAVSNILTSLSEAVATRREPGAGAKEYDLFLFLADRSRAFLRVRRDAASPDVFVDLRSLHKPGEPAKQWDALPAMVAGLGSVFDEIDSGSGDSIRAARLLPSPQAWAPVSRTPGEHGQTTESVASTALSLRALAQSDLDTIGIVSASVEEGKSPEAIMMIAGEAFNSTLSALAGAEDVEKPAEKIEGEPCVAFAFFRDKTRFTLRIVIPDDASDDALVGFIESDAGVASVSAPARVAGLGKILLPAIKSANAIGASSPETATAAENAAGAAAENAADAAAENAAGAAPEAK